MSKLIFNYSAMNSGKTMDLIRTAYNYEENGLKILIMKSILDTKGDNKIVTRIGLKRNVDILIGSNDNINSLLLNKIDDVKCIFVDEAQFLSKKQVYDLFIICKTFDIPVICYGLRTNFRCELFEGSKELLALSDELNEFKTLCRCGEIARFNARTTNGLFTLEGDSVLIDGEDEKIEYIPLCGKCYIEKVLNNKKVLKKIN